jgi:hypothetical protein
VISIICEDGYFQSQFITAEIAHFAKVKLLFFANQFAKYAFPDLNFPMLLF